MFYWKVPAHAHWPYTDQNLDSSAETGRDLILDSSIELSTSSLLDFSHVVTASGYSPCCWGNPATFFPSIPSSMDCLSHPSAPSHLWLDSEGAATDWGGNLSNLLTPYPYLTALISPPVHTFLMIIQSTWLAQSAAPLLPSLSSSVQEIARGLYGDKFKNFY